MVNFVNKKFSIFLCIIFLTISLIPSHISSQGFIIPREEFPIDEGSLTLQSFRIEAEVNNQNADIKLDQEFINELKHSFEGTYIFPAPKDAIIKKFSLFNKGKELKGEILEKDKARSIYESYIRKYRDPGLLEFIDNKMIRCSIFPVNSGEKRRIIISYNQELKTMGDLVKLSLSLKNLNKNKCQTLFISINIRDNHPINNIYSPSHNIEINKTSKNEAKITFEGKSEDGDFIIYYGINRNQTGLNLITHKNKDEDGYFMLLISPIEDINKSERINQNFIFVLDKSGSMTGEKIQQAKDALIYCLNNLNNNDRFNIITFSTQVETFNKNLVSPSEYRKEAINFINNVTANGGTNFNDALLESLTFAQETTNPLVIIFLTDGIPTVGERDIGKIIKNLTEKHHENLRFFTFGVGYDVNTHLLDLIALKNSGTSDYIEPGENIEQVVSSFFNKISKPSMTNITVEFGKTKVKETYPVSIPDLFYGTQIALVGKYDNFQTETIILNGKVKETKKSFKYDANFPKENNENDFLPIVWATRKIGYLLDEIRLNGENEELVDEIINLSKKYGIVTPYTSYLADEDEPVAIEPYPLTRPQNPLRTFPTFLVDGKNMIEPNHNNIPKISAEVGVIAVKASKLSKSLKEQSALYDIHKSNNVKRVNNQVFYFKNNSWISSEYKDGEKTIDIKYMSDAYLQILNKFGDLKKFFAIGDKIIVKYKNIFIKISETGKEKIDEDFLKLLENS
jgi:Ca-activated chloride channel family protein